MALPLSAYYSYVAPTSTILLWDITMSISPFMLITDFRDVQCYRALELLSFFFYMNSLVGFCWGTCPCTPRSCHRHEPGEIIGSEVVLRREFYILRGFTNCLPSLSWLCVSVEHCSLHAHIYLLNFYYLITDGQVSAGAWWCYQPAPTWGWWWWSLNGGPTTNPSFEC